MTADSFQVLSLDGGGMKGIFGAAVLAMIEDDFGINILDHVDLIAGTSTGGILALGLAAGMRPHELLDFYIEHQSRIFPKGRRLRPGLLRARYGDGGLRAALQEALGDRTFGSSRVRLVIPAFNLDANEVYVFRTPHHDRLRRDWRESMVDVALATSAAPTFLPSHRLSAVRLIDGGVWANNPSMAGLVEAVETCKVPLDRIQMLSIGTTSELKQRGSSLNAGGLASWAKPLVEILMTGQSLAARNHCSLLLPKGQFVRIDPVVPDAMFRLDRVNADSLISLARSTSRTIMPALESFVAHRAEPYRPHYTQGEKDYG